MPPRGHSNAHVEQTRIHPTNSDRSLTPISGGASVATVRPLPPLSLDRDEWLTIGQKMGWLTLRQRTAELRRNRHENS